MYVCMYHVYIYHIIYIYILKIFRIYDTCPTNVRIITCLCHDTSIVCDPKVKSTTSVWDKWKKI